MTRRRQFEDPAKAIANLRRRGQEYALKGHSHSIPDVLPKGVLGYAQVTAGQSGITSMTDLTGLSVVVSIPAGRLIRITGHALMSVSNDRSLAVGWIREGSSTVGRFGIVDNQALAVSAFALGHGAAILSSPSSGQHTYKLSVEVTTGSGTASITASSASPAYILVEDLGADPNA